MLSVILSFDVYRAVVHYDAVFYFAFFDGAVVSYACVGADVHVWFDDGVLSYYDWASDEGAFFYG